MSAVREEDLALLKIEKPVERAARGEGQGAARLEPAAETAFPTVRMGTSSDLMPGERVVAIGSPHGQTYTVSTGIISGLHRDIPLPEHGLHTTVEPWNRMVELGEDFQFGRFANNSLRTPNHVRMITLDVIRGLQVRCKFNRIGLLLASSWRANR